MKSVHEMLWLNVQNKYLKTCKDVRMEKLKSWTVTAVGLFAVRCWCFPESCRGAFYLLKTILFVHESLLLFVLDKYILNFFFFANNFSEQVVKSFSNDSCAGRCCRLAYFGAEAVHENSFECQVKPCLSLDLLLNFLIQFP